MTREEAYWMAKALRKDTAGSMREFYNVVIAALEEEPCDDAISRRAVDEAIYDYSRSCDVNYAQIMEYIDKIPSVNPQEPKTGHWISHYDEDEKMGWYECDRCHTERAFNTDYCPDCGAKMESEGKA